MEINMPIIEQLGNLGIAEAIASCALTTAQNPEYYCLDPKQYFNIIDGVVWFYDDDMQTYIEYAPLSECEFEYFSVSDIKQAVQNYKGQKHE